MNAARTSFLALRTWGKQRPADTRTVLCLVPAAVGGMLAMLVWVFFSAPLALYVCMIALVLSLAQGVTTGIAFFGGGSLDDLETQRARLDAERAALLADLEKAKDDRTVRRAGDARCRQEIRRQQRILAQRQREERFQKQQALAQQQAVAARIRASQQVVCPRCGSGQIHSAKKGYNTGLGGCGCCLLGPVGLILGMAGGSSILCTCVACGKKFRPGAGRLV